MHEGRRVLMPGLAMLAAAVLFMAGATVVARPMTAPGYILSALAIMSLVMGAILLLRSRRHK